MKNLTTLVRCIAVVMIGAGLSTGCAHRYPKSEAALDFTYPLDVCNPTTLKAAEKQVGNAPGELVHNKSTVCRTEAGAVGTPSLTVGPQPDELCPQVPEPLLAIANESDKDRQHRLEQQAFSLQERCLRRHLENSFATKKRTPAQFGIALSGGGSKASAFAIGVLAGLSDVRMLDRADFVSSVSGGSYAAYFYYAHRLFPEVRGGAFRVKATNEELFQDCVAVPDRRHATPEVIDTIRTRVPYCDRQSLLTYQANSELPGSVGSYQSFLKCMQDLMRPGDCNMDTTRSWRKGISLPTFGGSLVTIIPSFVSNSLFDWGLATSPSAISYRDGIGLAYGATLVDASNLSPELVSKRTRQCEQEAGPANAVLDCKQGFFDPDPIPMTFDELRVGLLKMRDAEGDGMPFWIINAAAPQHRSIYGWLKQGREDVTNSDMFEMTAVSHGSGRYGYVSASPAIHDMTVLDAVRASAAFLDANQLALKNRFVRTGAGLGLHLANLDWGIDIANYNVATNRRLIHRSLPFPFYYADSVIARASESEMMTPARRDRERSVFIRLIDGGNAENLGVYSLLKREVRNILIADAAQDVEGQFSDLCGLRRRLLNTPTVTRRFVYFPGLDNFGEHCNRLDGKNEEGEPVAGGKDSGYDLHAWFTDHPLLLGCIRETRYPDNGAASCNGLAGKEVRLLVVKPAINVVAFKNAQLSEVIRDNERERKSVLSECWVRDGEKPTQLLNCDTAAFLYFNHDVRRGDCPVFPQHSTVTMTGNSSVTLFVAYRELARQYIRRDEATLKSILLDDSETATAFESAVKAQAEPKNRLVALKPHCPRF